MRTPEVVIRDALFGCGLYEPGKVEVPEIMAQLRAEGWEIVRSAEGRMADRLAGPHPSEPPFWQAVRACFTGEVLRDYPDF